MKTGGGTGENRGSEVLPATQTLLSKIVDALILW